MKNKRFLNQGLDIYRAGLGIGVLTKSDPSAGGHYASQASTGILQQERGSKLADQPPGHMFPILTPGLSIREDIAVDAMVADMATDMEVQMVADMKMDKVADMATKE